MRHPRPDSIRFRPFHRYLLYAILAVLFFSGVVWACFNYCSAQFDSAAAKTWALKIHGAAAMATLILIGSVLPVHVRFAWRSGRNRSNGVLILSALGLLIITGYGLYYAGDDRLRAWSSWTHLGVGLLLPVLLVIHIILGRRTRPPGSIEPD